MRGWTLTLPREIPLWELESQWTPKFLENNCTSQNSMDWGIPYIIWKLLELTCLKWAFITHLDIWNTSYGQKKGRESNWQFDSWPLKVKKPRFPWFQVACDIPLERSRQGLQLFFRPHFNQRSARKVMSPQSCRSPSCKNFRTHTCESWEKLSFGCGPHGEAQSIL